MSALGFPTAALDFYDGLEEANTRDYWLANKGTYDSAVKAPMIALTEALSAEFGPAKLFRPNRDIRFSADKSPYKTHQGAFAGTTPGIGYYVEISAAGLAAGGGFHSPSTEQTAALRRAIDAPESGQRLVKIVAVLRDSTYDVFGESVKTTPRGYPADHPRIDLLRHKELLALSRSGSPDWITDERVLPAVQSLWRDLTPLIDWLVEHIPPAPPRR